MLSSNVAHPFSGTFVHVGHVTNTLFQKISMLLTLKGMEFSGGWGILEKILSMGGRVWIFSGTTHFAK